MPVAYFVSDVHIMSPHCPRARQFVEFLRSLSGEGGVTHLFLLGDIFDLWIADHDYFIENYRDIIAEIRRLLEDGVKVGFFEGNHDLHLRYFWADELGVAVYEGPAYMTLGESTVRLEHGDQMDPDDKGYLFLRWLLRTPLLRFLARRLPGRLVAGIGERASAASRGYSSNATVAEDAITKIRTHARTVHSAEPFDLIISGHLHVRDDVRLETGNGTFRSVNLGTWLDAPCCFRLDDGGGRFEDLAAN